MGPSGLVLLLLLLMTVEVKKSPHFRDPKVHQRVQKPSISVHFTSLIPKYTLILSSHLQVFHTQDYTPVLPYMLYVLYVLPILSLSI